MNSIPQIPGYQFDRQLLTHPLADLWRGRSFTGMEVVALVLSDAGSRDAVVRDRLVKAGRGAALEPGQEETPLWAANFSSDRPYAITQLIPGQSGAERLIDPLDGIIGNDAEALQTVRSQLSQYGAVPPNGDTQFPTYADQPQTDPHQPKPQSKVEFAREYRHKIGGWIYLASVLGVLVAFSITYSIGSAIGSTVKDEPVEAVPAAVSPSPFLSPALLPGVERVTTAQYKQPTGSPGVIGAAYAAGADVQPIVFAGLPFPFGWPRPPEVSSLGESSSAIYSRVVTRTDPGQPKGTLEARIALHPCQDLAGCLADRVAFDADWSKGFNAPAPTTAKDARTWVAEQKSEQKTRSYTLTMSHAFLSAGRWWLVGVVGTGATGEEQDVQRVVNDIWRQTS
ncbi:hypothetical protein ACGFIF_42070 [Kribbella sp. NPDC049174]|uniref:hypothetical protein n=1 Tax=Kribbella sp. NPDC049174 TaxID=3364112 RepID=UPI003716D30A